MKRQYVSMVGEVQGRGPESIASHAIDPFRYQPTHLYDKGSRYGYTMVVDWKFEEIKKGLYRYNPPVIWLRLPGSEPAAPDVQSVGQPRI